ncbi:hypothetical protein A6R68_04002, partial [Neotoma lepida]
MKSVDKTGISSKRALLKFSCNKYSSIDPATTSLQDRPESNVCKEDPFLAQYELPPSKKIKLVPLPFPALDKPQVRPVSRKPHPLASCRPTTAYPVRPHCHWTQPSTFKPSQAAPAITPLMPSDKIALPIDTSATRLNITTPVQSCTGPQPVASRPAPYRATSHTLLHRELVSDTRNKAPSSPEPQTQYLLPTNFMEESQHCRASQPTAHHLTAEANNRGYEEESENAANFTSLGKLQLFLQRNKDMEISRYYVYV